jgi:hypothetical protein
MKHITLSLCILSLLIMAGCKKFEEINTDPARPQETEPRFLLANAEKRASDIMYDGYYNCRIGMHFAQYWTGTDKTAESRNLLTNDGLWASLYSGPLMDLQEITNYYSRHPERNNPHMIAVSEILKAWIFHVLTDLYVDIPYTQALQVTAFPQPVFDGGRSIYNRLLQSLKEQVDILSDTPSPLIEGDAIANGDVQRWIRMANALRMRIAMRMADAAPLEAKLIVEEAAQNSLGQEEDIFFPYNTGSVTNRFPYNDADRPQVEFVMTATLIDYLKSVQDPRLPLYARKDTITRQYRGKPYGFADNIPKLDSLSIPGRAVYSPSFKGYIITYAEVAFIKAEAAARGMAIGGSAERLYTEAVEASMKQWGLQATDTAVTKYLLRVPYNAGDWKDVIGTQKWIAMYMQGLQSWMERLRLDMKKPDGSALFIAPASGSLDPDVADVPRRLNYPNATRNSNAAHCEEAAQRIGGDSKATRNWWDIY